MSHDDPDEGPDLEPAREDLDDPVRRLLAEARHTEPLPPEVAARLDTLLGQLVETRSAESGVTSLASRRNRRRGLLLVAAAAAVVAVAVPTINRAGTSSNEGATSADSSADSSAAQSQPEAAAPPVPQDAGDAAPSAPSPLQSNPQQAPAAKPGPPVTLTSDDFDVQVRALLGSPSADSSTYSLGRVGGDCPPPATTYPFLYVVSYDGRPALLGAALPEAGKQVADLYLCGQPEPVRSITVDLPR